MDVSLSSGNQSGLQIRPRNIGTPVSLPRASGCVADRSAGRLLTRAVLNLNNPVNPVYKTLPITVSRVLITPLFKIYGRID
jgi:hypothetical protein